MPDELPPAEDLQFRRAEPIASDALEAHPILRCRACQQIIPEEYYRAHGQVVCAQCLARIQSGQQVQQAPSLAHAVLYGAAAAVAGGALYAAVSILTGYEVGLIAIVVGLMVGKAIRYGAKGEGGRPQQIIAVTLTYFAITTSYIPVLLYHAAPSLVTSSAVVNLLQLALAAPFMGLVSSPLSSLISLFIIFIGLQRAWVLTAKARILVSGPYKLPRND